MDRLILPEIELMKGNHRPPRAIENLLQYLNAEEALSRKPLFVLGAGISAGEVPFLSEMARHLAEKIEQEKERGSGISQSERESLESLKRLGEKIASNEALRSDAAEFFFTLQGSASRRIRNRVKGIWEEFSHDLLSEGTIRRAGTELLYHKPIQQATPTDCHELIARQLIEQKAWCINFNFDRLTAQAVHKVSPQNRGCAVLHTQDQVDGYFSAPGESGGLPAVFKIRGDVFYASCTHPGCALRQAPIPLHTFLRTDQSVKNRSTDGLPTGRLAKLCPECGTGSLVLELSFPGFRAKEEEAFPLLKKIASYIHHRLSAIIVIGLSGHWDDYILEFLSGIAVRSGIPIVDVKPDVDELNPIAEFVRVHPGKPRYLPLKLKAKEFADYWKKAEEKLSSRPVRLNHVAVHEEEGFVRSDEFSHDRVWLKDDSSEIRLKVGDSETVVRLDDLRNRLENLIPSVVKRRLSSSAQLAIDNIVLTGSPGAHNRWNHSLGTALVGLTWFRRLASDGHLGAIDSDKIEVILTTALLLHDYGHLPFSHLAEQVIDEINWASRLHQLFGSEFNVLYHRLFGNTSPEHERVKSFLQRFESRAGLREQSGAALLLRLIGGIHAEPWQSAILNSPVDADKIDYVFRDIRELSSAAGSQFSFQTRLPHLNPNTWLAEFLADQYVNQHGVLCFNGRSAMALFELLEERMFLYRYLYRAPEVRLAERMAAEFVRQFFILGVWGKVISDSAILDNFSNEPDLRGLKNYQLQELLEAEYADVGYRETKEWLLLERIQEIVQSYPMDRKYRELLNQIWQHLQGMGEKRSLSHLRSKLQDGIMVESPFYFPKAYFPKLRHLIRPLQHQYCCDVLFDLVTLPSFLSGPRPLHLSVWDTSSSVDFINMLVPRGPADEWNFRSAAQVPLTSEVFRKRQDDICMVYIFDPFEGNRPQSYYALDKFIAACKREGIPFSTDAAGGRSSLWLK